MTKSVYADNKLSEKKVNDAWTKLFALIPDGSSVLDIGCSSGNFGSALIKQKKCTVVGIDIFEDDLKLAAKRLTRVEKRNIETAEIDDLGKFDIVVMADVIEHLIDPVSALNKIKKCIRKDGLFIFSVPNMANIATRIELLEGRFTYTSYGILDETHLHYYDRVQLEMVLSAAGMKVLQYNNTIREIPKDILENQLNTIGLKADDKFWQLANNVDAITFQFIGVAVPDKSSSVKHAKVESKTPHDFMSTTIDGIIKDFQNKLGKAQDAATKLKQENNDLKQALKDEEQRLTAITNSKGWKALEKTHQVLDPVYRIARKK